MKRDLCAVHYRLTGAHALDGMRDVLSLHEWAEDHEEVKVYDLEIHTVPPVYDQIIPWSLRLKIAAAS